MIAVKWKLADIEDNINRSVPAFLTSSYLYYHRPDLDPIMDDYDFDRLCSIMLKRYDEITHRHKYLIREDTLSAGTGFDIPEHIYPNIVKSTAVAMSLGHITKQ